MTTTTTTKRVPLKTLEPGDTYRTHEGGVLLEVIKHGPEKSYVRVKGGGDPVGSSVNTNIDPSDLSVNVIPVGQASEFVRERRRLNVRIVEAHERVIDAERTINDIACGDDTPARIMVARLILGRADQLLGERAGQFSRTLKADEMERLAQAIELVAAAYREEGAK